MHPHDLAKEPVADASTDILSLCSIYGYRLTQTQIVHDNWYSRLLQQSCFRQLNPSPIVLETLTKDDWKWPDLHHPLPLQSHPSVMMIGICFLCHLRRRRMDHQPPPCRQPAESVPVAVFGFHPFPPLQIVIKLYVRFHLTLRCYCCLLFAAPYFLIFILCSAYYYCIRSSQ